MHVDYGITDDCINHWSYGEICVRCGCCSNNPNYKDKTIRTIRYYKECLKEEENFNWWDEDEFWRKVQERNVKSNILWYKRKIRKYKKILRTLK